MADTTEPTDTEATAAAPDEAASELAARMARGEALLANATGDAEAHVRTVYEPLDPAEANRKAARRTPPRKGTLQPAKYQPLDD
ncbi:hypothetical protein I5G87_gp91 [Mycobacterium phage Ekdilam]|uniref:Uncharacterized protein n=1 Tax=Mycobacterium phage Ekdilam TaxID=2599862 RepID=A0A5J6TL04_9CAUD|nr:hypothetical protein I5G87_gp91 [Mycobacterium phage Ekdilam]QFG11515.1 hypothetical protein PBI_EKDILAM_91 [Mycobacterium phage Ekdilam]